MPAVSTSGTNARLSFVVWLLRDRYEGEQSEHPCREAQERCDKGPQVKESGAADFLFSWLRISRDESQTAVTYRAVVGDAEWVRFRANQSRVSSRCCVKLPRQERRSILGGSFEIRAIEFGGAPRFAATLVGDLHPIRLFARWRAPAQVFASLFRRNPSRQAAGNPFACPPGLNDHNDSHQNGARIARARDSVRLHLPKRQHLRAFGRTSGAVGSRCLRRNNLGGANESHAVLLDLVFARLTLVFAFCNLRPGRARRFGGA